METLFVQFHSILHPLASVADPDQRSDIHTDGLQPEFYAVDERGTEQTGVSYAFTTQLQCQHFLGFRCVHMWAGACGRERGEKL
jgi:hypothetical protein